MKNRGGIYKLVSGPTRIGTRAEDVDNDDTIATMNKIHDEGDSEEEEDEAEGIDIDLEDDGIEAVQD